MIEDQEAAATGAAFCNRQKGAAKPVLVSAPSGTRSKLVWMHVAKPKQVLTALLQAQSDTRCK